MDDLQDQVPIQTIPRANLPEVRVPRGDPAFSPSNVKLVLNILFAVVGLVENKQLPQEALDVFESPEIEVIDEYFPGLFEVAEHIQETESIEPTYLKSFQLGLRRYSKTYEGYMDSVPQVKALINNFRSYLSTRKDLYRNALDRASADLAYPVWTGEIFSIDSVPNQEDIQDEMRSIVEEYNGDSSLFIKSPQEEKEMKEKSPELWDRYIRARKEFNHTWLQYVAAFVRESGQKLAPYSALLDEMEENGYESDLPIGFDGYIDAAARIYTKDKKMIEGRPRRAYTPVVLMNKDPSKKGQFKVMDWNGRVEDAVAKKTYYTKEHHQESAVGKFGAVKEFGSYAEHIRKRWLRELTGSDTGVNPTKVFSPADKEQVVALVIELVWQTAARIGNAENATAGEKTYGLSTVLVSQTRFNQNSVSITYKGKDAVLTKHVIKAIDPLNKYIVEALRTLATSGDKTRSDHLFTYVTKQGKSRRVGDYLVNTELKNFYQVPSGFTIHNIRTYHGTKIFEDELDKTFKKYDKLDKKGAKQVIESLAMIVGKKLNHVRRGVEGEEVTGATALANYIDPNAQAKFYEHYGVPLPAYLAKKLGVGIDTKVEAATESAPSFLDSDSFPEATEDLLEDTSVPMLPESMNTDEESVDEVSEPTSTESEVSEEAPIEEEEPPVEEAALENDSSTEDTNSETEDKKEEPEVDPEEELAEAERKEKEEMLEKTKPTPLSILTEELLMKHGDASLYV